MSSHEHLQNGRYVILKKLGEGGKGVVYKVRDTILNRVVAIKMLKSAATNGEAYSRFIRVLLLSIILVRKRRNGFLLSSS